MPNPAKPVGSYIPVVIAGKLAFVSGQIPYEDGRVNLKGKVDKDLNIEAGQQAARLCVINGLSQLKSVIGNLDLIKQVIKVTGFVNSDPEFTDHPKVVNGASDLLVEVFGEKGRHARAAVGVSSLPLGSCVEVEILVELI